MSLAGTRNPAIADGPVLGAPAAAPTGSITLIRPAAVRQRRSVIRIPRLARRAIGLLVALGLWQLASSLGLFTSVEVASPIAVIDAGRELWAQGALQSNLLIS